MVRVKICGITTVRDAVAALDYGADAIGLIFAESPRKVTVSQAKKISAAVGPWVSVVGVFVNEAPAVIRRVAEECRFSTVQLHGHEVPADLLRLKGLRIVKTFHMEPGFRLNLTGLYRCADAFLFDTRTKDLLGGTGKVFDWKLLKSASLGRPLIVSGGLCPANVGQVIRLLAPYGVDVSSGVEKAPGKKDFKKLKDFIRNAKNTR